MTNDAQPMISIVTATYQLLQQGRKESFCQMVESVAGQDYPNIQHIIVDGGSTDGTKELIQSFADQGMIDHWISEKDKGLYDAMNKGTRMASGDYVGTLNSDDYYHDCTGITRMVDALVQCHADYAYSRLIMLDPDTGEKSLSSRPNMLAMVRGMPFAHPGLFIKKTIFEELGGYDDSYDIIADNDFITRMLLRCPRKGVYVKPPFITFRLGGVSSAQDGSSQKKVQQETARMYQKLYADMIQYADHEWQKMAESKTLSVGLLWTLFWHKQSHYQIKFACIGQMTRALRKGLWRLPTAKAEVSV